MTSALTAEAMAAAAGFAHRVEQLRREWEGETHAALLALVEVADAVARLCEDPPGGVQVSDGLLALRGKVGSVLAARGLSPVPADGCPVDLRWHHVAGVCDGPGPADTIARQLRPGFLWRGQVLRPAEVIAVRPTPPGDRPS